MDDKGTVKYDLSTGLTIGKRGNPVNNLCSQLRGYSISEIVDSFENKNYANFLNFVHHQVGSYITNIGTLLDRTKKYLRYEQIFSTGISNVSSDVRETINQIPKGLIKLCRDYNLILNQGLILSYKNNPDAYNIAFSTEFISLTINHLITLLTHRKYRYTDEYITTLNLLNTTYNYNIKSLLIYIDNLYTYEAIEDVHYVLSEFKDYVEMMSRISPKYDKYPRNFLTTHKIACRNYNRLKEQFVEEDFNKVRNETLEYSFGKYKFIYPKNTQEIKDEAVQQNNCVASYISRVIKGECHILFMREKTDLGNSLVTIEVRGGKIVQAKGRFNRDITIEEREVINKYNNRIERINKAR